MTRVITILACVGSVLSSSASQRSAVDLSDANCRSEVLIAALEGVDIHASCDTDGSEQVMHVAVTNWAKEEVGSLRGFSIGLCGRSVVSASAQSGGIVTIDAGENAVVSWDLPVESADQFGVPPRARVGGFAVRLRPGWKRSRSASALWESVGVGTATTHDC
jgi:hypothetical protein